MSYNYIPAFVLCLLTYFPDTPDPPTELPPDQQIKKIKQERDYRPVIQFYSNKDVNYEITELKNGKYDVRVQKYEWSCVIKGQYDSRAYQFDLPFKISMSVNGYLSMKNENGEEIMMMDKNHSFRLTRIKKWVRVEDPKDIIEEWKKLREIK